MMTQAATVQAVQQAPETLGQTQALAKSPISADSGSNYRHLIRTIDIQAPREVVWQVLTDFSRYSQWSTFINRIDGKAEEGARLEVELQPIRMKPSVFKPMVVTYEADREFAWLGKLGWGGLFDGEHRFRLEDLPGGGTRLVHSERFGGILVPLLKSMLTGATAQGFESFNQAIKREAEGKMVSK